MSSLTGCKRFDKKRRHKKERIENNNIVCNSYEDFLNDYNEELLYWLDYDKDDWFHWFPCPIWKIKQGKDMEKEDFICDNCNEYKGYTLYEGWFYHPAKNNPYAKGTVTASLMQFKTVCEECLRLLQKTGLTKCGDKYVDNVVNGNKVYG